MDDFLIMAVKAAALHKAAGGRNPQIFKSFAELASSPVAKQLPAEAKTGVRALETGLAIPKGATPQPLKATDKPSSEMTDLDRYSGTPTEPQVGGKSGVLSSILGAMKSRPAVAGGATLLSGGLGLGAYNRMSRPSPMSTAVPPTETPVATEAPRSTDINPRAVAKQKLLGRAGGAVGSWWGKMSKKYGLGPQEGAVQ